MPAVLYTQLQDEAGDNIAQRFQLDALHSTLDHFGVENNRELMAEAILRLAKLTSCHTITPGDEKITLLIKMLEHYEELING